MMCKLCDDDAQYGHKEGSPCAVELPGVWEKSDLAGGQTEANSEGLKYV